MMSRAAADGVDEVVPPSPPSMRSLPSPPNIVSLPSWPSSVIPNVALSPKMLVAARRSFPKPPKQIDAARRRDREVGVAVVVHVDLGAEHAALRGVGVGEPGALDVDNVAAGTGDQRQQHAPVAPGVWAF